MNFNAYIKLCRPQQWLKNLMLYFPPLFGGTLLNNGVVLKGLIPIIAFCFASTSTYIINDIVDRNNDANHPLKQKRPIPQGLISVKTAYIISSLFFLGAIILGLKVSSQFFLIIVAYAIIQIFYTYKFKELAIIDIFCIAAGFVLRLQAGGIVFELVISSWLILSVFLLALFLGTGKRLGESQSLGERAGEHRKSLASYPPGFLEGVLYMTGGSVLVTYTMFVISRQFLIYTVPLCCFGLLRYIYRIKSGEDGDPTEALLKDYPLFCVSLLWAFMVLYAYYLSS
jgi:4-hydroxybenzoate polyprenyltransferase